MIVLVVNCGSSSIKYQLFDMSSVNLLAKGNIEKIGMIGSFMTNERNDGDNVRLEGEIVDHQAGIGYILGVLISQKHGSIKDIEEIQAVGHRVVHGGEKFNSSVLITNDVIKGIEDCIEIAPLHNPPNLKGISALKSLLPGVPQVAVFDTAFHQSMPPLAYMYAIPYSLYKKYAIRRYGFHGTSHRYVSSEAAKMLGVPLKEIKVITCHLGNGSSIAAVKNGLSIDTSMGMTPLEGLIMGTRCGDIDPGILTYIMHKEEIGLDATNALLNKHSGLLGITSVSSDMRDIKRAAYEEKNHRAELGLKMYAYRIKKYIGAYAAAMCGIDAVVFTGGVGENDAELRKVVCDGLDFMGIKINQELNSSKRIGSFDISLENKGPRILVIPTNEELVIALDTMEIVGKKNECLSL